MKLIYERMIKINILAEELNEILKEKNIYIFEMLSELGKKFYYPRGILSQSSEAKSKAYKFDATIGMATEKGQPMYLDSIHENLSSFSPNDLYPYTSPEGKKELREVWKNKMIYENPSLANKSFSAPIVTNALTNGLSIIADLFVESGDTIILPDKYWGNYNLIFGLRREANFKTFPFFNQNAEFNIKEFKNTISQVPKQKKIILLLNFPNNPTGYTPSNNEIQKIIEIILDAAKEGRNIVCIIDDAYFQLVFDDFKKESIFSSLINLHRRILPIKIDGVTKEEYAWGFRIGFITYGIENIGIQKILEQKTKGVIRSTISSTAHPSQTFILNALKSPHFREEKLKKYEILKGRAHKVKEVLKKKKYNKVWSSYPFNSGYFMCIKLKNVEANSLRELLLEEYGIGTIAINLSDLRIAFSGVDENDIEELFECIYQAAIRLNIS